MASNKLIIELKFDHDDTSKDQAIIKAGRRAAKTLYTTALLLKDRRAPQIAMHNESFFEGEADINVEELDDEEAA